MCRLKEYALRLKFFRKLLVRVALPFIFIPNVSLEPSKLETTRLALVVVHSWDRGAVR